MWNKSLLWTGSNRKANQHCSSLGPLHCFYTFTGNALQQCPFGSILSFLSVACLANKSRKYILMHNSLHFSPSSFSTVNNYWFKFFSTYIIFSMCLAYLQKRIKWHLFSNFIFKRCFRWMNIKIWLPHPILKGSWWFLNRCQLVPKKINK